MRLLSCVVVSLFILSCFFISKTNTTTQQSMSFSKEWSFFLKGILALFILTHHVSTHYTDWWGDSFTTAYSFFYQFNIWGTYAVGIFFFISGYGLLKSYQKNEQNYIDNFLRKRFLKIFIPFFSLGIIQIICEYFFIDNYSIVSQWREFQTSHANFLFLWFPTILCLFYFFFYISFQIFKHSTFNATWLTSLLILILSLYLYFQEYRDWWWRSNICFIIGLWYSYFETSIAKIVNKRPLVCLAGITLTLLGVKHLIKNLQLSYVYIWYQFGINFILPIFIVWTSYYIPLMFPKVIAKVLTFLSEISYELFLTHVIFIIILPKTMSPFAFYVLLLTCSITTAYFTHKAFSYIQIKIKDADNRKI